MNLLFSLPDVLMREVYDFDPTFHIYGTVEFKTQLINKWAIICNKICINQVTTYMEDIIRNGVWSNEYGFIATDAYNDNYNDYKRIRYTSTNDFEIYIHPPQNNILYFKVIPKGSTPNTCSFLRNPRDFDGFFCHTDTDKELDNNIEYYRGVLSNIFGKHADNLTVDGWLNPRYYKTTDISMWF